MRDLRKKCKYIRDERNWYTPEEWEEIIKNAYPSIYEEKPEPSYTKEDAIWADILEER